MLLAWEDPGRLVRIGYAFNVILRRIPKSGSG